MVEIVPLPPLRRYVLRGDPAPLGALGLKVPPLLQAAAAGAVHVLALGPDEWWVMAEAPPAWPGGAWVTEVSAGRAGVSLAGPDAPLLLAEGCPLDLTHFPAGACTRTLFGKVEILLWRRGEALWHVETARSFAPHLAAHLAEARADLLA
ncbi:sarcosine oxidase subunit gamma [Siccirubricoccus phaeus]|uniref:sarcosine oxidase subunit gamma n=1 Tax=Siccirubricoccus phaeus TaxID=2595053 RepID=UPI0011F0E8A4|nr:sarcosine oxidase gamma subunit [Siccirubricoccus phaeus]